MGRRRKFDESKVRRWPAHTPESRGGEFAPKTSAPRWAMAVAARLPGGVKKTVRRGGSGTAGSAGGPAPRKSAGFPKTPYEGAYRIGQDRGLTAQMKMLLAPLSDRTAGPVQVAASLREAARAPRVAKSDKTTMRRMADYLDAENAGQVEPDLFDEGERGFRGERTRGPGRERYEQGQLLDTSGGRQLPGQMSMLDELGNIDASSSSAPSAGYGRQVKDTHQLAPGDVVYGAAGPDDNLVPAARRLLPPEGARVTSVDRSGQPVRIDTTAGPVYYQSGTRLVVEADPPFDPPPPPRPTRDGGELYRQAVDFAAWMNGLAGADAGPRFAVRPDLTALRGLQEGRSWREVTEQLESEARQHPVEWGGGREYLGRLATFVMRQASTATPEEAAAFKARRAEFEGIAKGLFGDQPWRFSSHSGSTAYTHAQGLFQSGKADEAVEYLRNSAGGFDRRAEQGGLLDEEIDMLRHDPDTRIRVARSDAKRMRRLADAIEARQRPVPPVPPIAVMTAADRKKLVARYAGMTRAEFDAQPAAFRAQILQELLDVSTSGDKKRAFRDSMGSLVRGAEADHVTRARSLRASLIAATRPTRQQEFDQTVARLKAGQGDIPIGYSRAELVALDEALGLGESRSGRPTADKLRKRMQTALIRQIQERLADQDRDTRNRELRDVNGDRVGQDDPDFVTLRALADAKTVVSMRQFARERGIKIPGYLKKKDQIREWLGREVRYNPGEDLDEYATRTRVQTTLPVKRAAPGMTKAKRDQVDKALETAGLWSGNPYTRIFPMQALTAADLAKLDDDERGRLHEGLRRLLKQRDPKMEPDFYRQAIALAKKWKLDVGDVDKTPKRGAAGQPNAATVRQELLKLRTNEQRMAYLAGLGLSQAQANRLARDLGARQTRIDADATLRNIVVHFDLPRGETPPERGTFSRANAETGDIVEWRPRGEDPVRGTVRQAGRVVYIDWDNGRSERILTYTDYPDIHVVEGRFTRDSRAIDRAMERDSPAGIVRQLREAPSEREARIILGSTPVFRLALIAQEAGLNIRTTWDAQTARDAIINHLVPKKRAFVPADMARIFDGSETREQAAEVLRPLTIGQMRQIAAELDLTLPGSARTRPQVLSALVEGRIGNRIDSLAIRGNATLPYGDRPTPRPVRTQAQAQADRQELLRRIVQEDLLPGQGSAVTLSDFREAHDIPFPASQDAVRILNRAAERLSEGDGVAGVTSWMLRAARTLSSETDDQTSRTQMDPDTLRERRRQGQDVIRRLAKALQAAAR